MPKNIYPHLSRAIEGFLYFKAAQGRAAGTLQDYRINLERFCTYLEDPPLNEVTPKQIDKFFHYLQHEYTFDPSHTGRTTNLRKLKPKTIANAWTSLSSFWNWVLTEYSIHNPLKMPRIKAKSEPIVPLTEDEIEKLLKACDNIRQAPVNRVSFRYLRPTRLRDRAVILVLYDTGVRVSELCGLRYRDVDFGNNRILVKGKGKKNRYVYIGKVSTQALWRYTTERYPKEQPQDDEYVFTNNYGSKMKRNAVGLLLRRLGNKAGVAGVHAHRFRHSFGVAYIRNGGYPFSLQDILGHSTMDMVRKYVHLARTDIQEIHKRASPGDKLLRR